ncbi:MAG: hypothetical protein GY755_02310 [Chloroflexi bacterium]|nr:hypothetical protein [Chloroflexota bacterium]
MTLAKELALNTLEKINTRFSMEEVGDPHLVLSSPAAPDPLGACRIFKGEQVHKMVYIGLTFAPAGLDSHMVFAFTPADSLLPHFTLDSVMAGPTFAFHLDVLPRVDLGVNLAYTDEILTPLTDTFTKAKEIEGLSAAHLSPRQLAVMSPWMLAHRATEDAFTQIGDVVNTYLDHWFGLVETGITSKVEMGAEQASMRDKLHRRILFDPEVDPVWAQVSGLIGEENSAKLRAILKNQEIE